MTALQMPRNQMWGLAAMAFYALLFFVVFVQAFHYKQVVLAILACLCASPVPMVIAALLFEGRSIGKVADPRTGSWAFLFGDPVFLPFMAAALVVVWSQYDIGEHVGRWWIPIAMVAGIALGFAFHLMDGGNYHKMALNSPTKLVHDFVAFPVLAGGLTYGLGPILFSSHWRSLLIPCIGLGLWVIAAVCDNTIHKLDPQNLHPLFDWDAMEVIPYHNN